MPRSTFPISLVVLFGTLGLVLAQQPSPDNSDQTGASDAAADILAGHSYHGEFLNEGPRQSAYLMQGTGKVDFPVTTTKRLARQFVEQGLGQVYGFWYLEAERSFRQAFTLDEDCAMAYWGAALATLQNEKRSKGFIAEAVKRKGNVTERERMYIQALDKFIQAGKAKKKERAKQYTKDLEAIAIKFADDVEAKALLALQLYNNKRAGNEIESYLAVDGLMQQIFAVEPLHSAHHFRIHLWDYTKPEIALTSAALCGQGSPSIAHMWHMPGHIYSRLKRYDDACWQQEASARVDHAHMMRDHVMPDQISNFAHNNEWLIRNLNYVGRVRDALDLAQNMIELPRHPKYNTIKKRGSTNYGRTRLFETLDRYELWEQMIELCQSPYLEPTDDPREQIKRMRHLGRAYFRSGEETEGAMVLAQLGDRLQQEKSEQNRAVDKAARQAEARQKERPPSPITGQKTNAAQRKAIEKAKRDAKKPFATKIRDLEKAIAELEGHQKFNAQRYQEAARLYRKASLTDQPLVARTQLLAGDADKGIETIKKHVGKHKNEVQPLAHLTYLLWLDGRKAEAQKQFGKLREISASIQFGSPVFERLKPVALAAGHDSDWRKKFQAATDVGQRPDLNDLGPFRWRPSPAAPWELEDADGDTHSLADYNGQPVVLIFYLGYGCLHCAEQLHAFAPMHDEFKAAGLPIVAISTDDRQDLLNSIEDYDKGDLPFPLLANASLDVFKRYRAHDDFEDQPLHGTFLIDAEGLIRWQDISYEPFMDPEFLLREAKRLLGQSKLSEIGSLTATCDATTQTEPESPPLPR